MDLSLEEAMIYTYQTDAIKTKFPIPTTGQAVISWRLTNKPGGCFREHLMDNTSRYRSMRCSQFPNDLHLNILTYNITLPNSISFW